MILVKLVHLDLQDKDGKPLRPSICVRTSKDREWSWREDRSHRPRSQGSPKGSSDPKQVIILGRNLEDST